jgi:hypothetical protein
LSDLDEVITWAETTDLTVLKPDMLVNLSLAGIEARHWYRNENAEMPEDVTVEDMAGALILGARADVELLKRGVLDAYLLRHRCDGDAALRLTKKVAQKLPETDRLLIESEECDDFHAVDSVVAAQLVETVIEVVSPNPVKAYLDAGTGQRHVLVRAVVNDVIDAGRKTAVRKIEMESFDDGLDNWLTEIDAVEDEYDQRHFIIEEQPEPHPAHPLRSAVEQAIAKLKTRKKCLTRANVAKEMDISRMTLHRRLTR